MVSLAGAERILEGLNTQQREAVSHVDGPLLILAGPGSGKTRVIVHRIAYLLDVQGVYPSRLLAVTFTNKAAREMRERLDTLVGPQVARGLAVGTFHAICARWLRRDIKELGRDPGFAIYDDDDQIDLVKQVLEELAIDEKRTSPRAVLSAISHAKSELIEPGALRLATRKGYWQETVARSTAATTSSWSTTTRSTSTTCWAQRCELFREVPDVLERYQERFHYVMVDEFQDTNIAQYEIVKLLSKSTATCASSATKTSPSIRGGRRTSATS